MRVAIYGTGGAGGYLGAQLARIAEDVTFIARGQHLAAIQSHGLCVETPAGEIVIQPAKATDDPTQVGLVDVVLLGVKVWQVDEAARKIRPMVGPATFMVPLQNGVEAASQLAAVLGAEHVLGGLCGTFSWRGQASEHLKSVHFVDALMARRIGFAPCNMNSLWRSRCLRSK